MNWKLLICFAVVSCYLKTAAGQDAAPMPRAIAILKDSLEYVRIHTPKPKPPKDSLQLYKNIHEFAEKTPFTHWIFQQIFSEKALHPQIITEPTPPVKKQAIPSAPVPTDNFESLNGKIIRTIEIITLDPFGKNVSDTTTHKKNLVKYAGNTFHIKSKRATIKNQLLIHRGKSLDALALRESERILQSDNYVREAKITVRPAGTDSVDVIVIVQDRWSIVVGASVSGGSTRISIGEKNFLGFGHQFRNNIRIAYNDPFKPQIEGSYSTPYILNTFINATGYYSNNETNRIRGLVLNRPFYSPIAKWGGGASILNFNTSANYLVDTLPVAFPIQYEQKDIWVGKSFQLQPGSSVIKRTTRLIIAGGFTDTHYIRRPSFDYDRSLNNQNNKLYLASIGVNNQQYYKDKLIYRFGEAEFVPTGRVFSITGGQQQNEFSHRYYASARMSAGDHFTNIGHLAISGECGSFFRNTRSEDGLLSLGLNYFTDRWSIKKWSGRQFVYYQLTRGFNRAAPQKITINDNSGVYGFKSQKLEGDRKMYLNLVSVVYTPIKFIGFRFAVLLFAGFGTIGETKNALLNNRIYQGYGLGFLIRNEQLIVKSFQVSFGIYPFVPDAKNPQFRMDVISTDDLRYKEYGISRPSLLSFQ